jgi:carbon monoxide dehydrogenase subunit G
VNIKSTSDYEIAPFYTAPFKQLRLLILSLLTALMLISSSAERKCRAEEKFAAPQTSQPLDSNREFTVTLSKLENGVTGLKSTIYINAPPEQVWKVLTDYNNLKRYIPRMVESDLVEDKGNLKVIALKGEFRVLLLKKTIHVTINMHETYPLRIDYEKIAGNFEVYQGFWMLEELPSTKGTHLTYVSELKPSFLAPDFIFLGILKKDITGALSALRKQAEELPAK